MTYIIGFGESFSATVEAGTEVEVQFLDEDGGNYAEDISFNPASAFEYDGDDSINTEGYVKAKVLATGFISCGDSLIWFTATNSMQYTVCFNPNGATARLQYITHNINSDSEDRFYTPLTEFDGEINTFERANHTLLGWASSPDSREPVTQVLCVPKASYQQAMSNCSTYYAIWQNDGVDHTLTFESNDDCYTISDGQKSFADKNCFVIEIGEDYSIKINGTEIGIVFDEAYTVTGWKNTSFNKEYGSRYLSIGKTVLSDDIVTLAPTVVAKKKVNVLVNIPNGHAVAKHNGVEIDGSFTDYASQPITIVAVCDDEWIVDRWEYGGNTYTGDTLTINPQSDCSVSLYTIHQIAVNIGAIKSVSVQKNETIRVVCRGGFEDNGLQEFYGIPPANSDSSTSPFTISSKEVWANADEIGTDEFGGSNVNWVHDVKVLGAGTLIWYINTPDARDENDSKINVTIEGEEEVQIPEYNISLTSFTSFVTVEPKSIFKVIFNDYSSGTDTIATEGGLVPVGEGVIDDTHIWRTYKAIVSGSIVWTRKILMLSQTSRLTVGVNGTNNIRYGIKLPDADGKTYTVAKGSQICIIDNSSNGLMSLSCDNTLKLDSYEDNVATYTVNGDGSVYLVKYENPHDIGEIASRVYIKIDKEAEVIVTPTTERMDLGEQYMFAVDEDGKMYTLIFGSTFSTVKSFKIYSGPSNPFEYITISLSSSQLRAYNSDIYDEESDSVKIYPGKTKIMLNCIKKGTYIVSSLKSRSGIFTITAYVTFEKIRSAFPSGNLDGTMSTIFEELLSNGKLQGLMEYSGVSPTDCDDQVYFKGDTSIWYDLQVCATHLGAKIYFDAEGGHMVDYFDTTNRIARYEQLYIGTTDDDVNESAPKFHTPYNISGLTCDNNSSDSLVNAVSITYGEDNNLTHPANKVIVSDYTSEIHTPSSTINLPYRVASSVQKFSQGYVKYTSFPSMALTFTLSGAVLDGNTLYFEQSIPTKSIVSANGKIAEFDNTYYAVPNVKGKGYILSSLEYSYPEYSIQYTFGNHQPVSLDTTLSKIING